MRGIKIYLKLCCVLTCLHLTIGSKFLAPLIIRPQGVAHKVTLLSEIPTEVMVRRPGMNSDNPFNVAYSHPLQLEITSTMADATRNYKQANAVLQLTSDGSTVAFLSSESLGDLSMTSLISIDSDSNGFVVPYFVSNVENAALVISGTDNYNILLIDPNGKAQQIKADRGMTVRTVLLKDITGYQIQTVKPTAVYIDIPCLVSAHQPGVCGTAHIPVPPTSRLGYDHVIPRPPGRHFNIAYRVVAALTNTHVLVWDQSNGWNRVASLGVGEFYDGESSSGSGSISVKCDEPCSVTQVLATNTSYNFKALEVVPDLTKSKRTVIFELDTLPPGDVHYITMLTLTIHQRSLLLNGIPLGGARWTVLPSWSDWSLASFPVPEGSHNISSTDGLAPILAWHYAVFNEEVITMGSLTGFGCQDHLCMRRDKGGECITCREGLILEAGKCRGPEILAAAGENVTLPCFFMMSQTTNVINWYKERDNSVCGYEGQSPNALVASLSSTGVISVLPRLNTRVGLETSGGNLEISDVQTRDEGYYTCHSYGSIMARVQVKLSVFVVPTDISTSWSIVGEEDDFKLKLTCHVNRVSPLPSDFHWLLPDGTHAGKSSFSDNSDGSLEASLTHYMEVTPSVKGVQCVMVIRDRTYTMPLPFDGGLRLLLSALGRTTVTVSNSSGKEINGSENEDSHIHVGTIIGAVIGGIVILLLIAVLLSLIFCARGFTKSQRPPESPVVDSVGYYLRQCGCPQATINRGEAVATCSPISNIPRPSCSSEMTISGSRRELLVCIENDYDSLKTTADESIATTTTTTTTST